MDPPRDLVLGLIEADQGGSVTLVRLDRKDGTNTCEQLNPADIGALWSDPVLRYSNVLQGLFHRQVCVCEADADCRLYGAVLDVLAEESSRRRLADETLFVPSGGKGRVATMVNSVATLGVSVAAIVDFDVLHDKSQVVQIVRSLQGTWSESMQNDYVTVADALHGGNLWPHVKSHGVAGVPPGNPNAAASRLLKSLESQRLLIVPVGEMEGFDRTIGAKGAA